MPKTESQESNTRDERIALALSKSWFYPFVLPDGRPLSSGHSPTIKSIHETRRQMLESFLDRTFEKDRSRLNAIDLACHQGFFSIQLANQGFGDVLGIDIREEHVEDVSLLSEIYGLSNLRVRRDDIFDLSTDETFDVVLMFGLLYHLENPVGALRKARALTRKVCLVETQVVPNLSGMVDWGSFEYVRPLKGVFGIIDELDETQAPEASVTGICLAPSVEGLLWTLRAVGFREAHVLPVPDGGYEQLRHGKRIMVAAKA